MFAAGGGGMEGSAALLDSGAANCAIKASLTSICYINMRRTDKSLCEQQFGLAVW